jgi:hypothetical protein
MELWDKNLMKELNSQKKFLYILSDSDKNDKISILDSMKFWDENVNILFSMSTRLAGEKSMLFKILINYYPNSTVSGIIEKSISIHNFRNNELYLNEIEEFKKINKKIIKKNIGSDGIKLDLLVKELQSRELNVKSYLQDKYDKIPEGYVLDVSKIKNDGKGATYVRNKNKMKKGVFGLNIVSSNLNSYIHAVHLLDDGPEKYESQIEDIKKIFQFIKDINYIDTIKTSYSEEYEKTMKQNLNEKQNIELLPNEKISTFEVYNTGSYYNLPNIDRKIDKMKENKVLDISNLYGDGTGSQVIPINKIPSDRIKVPGLPIVTNNYHNFEIVISSMTNYERRFKNAIEFMKKHFSVEDFSEGEESDKNEDDLISNEESDKNEDDLISNEEF